MKSFKLSISFIVLLFCYSSSIIFSQTSESTIQAYLLENNKKLDLTESDVKNWIVYDKYTSKQSQLEHIYIRQQHEGIEIYNSVANFAIQQGKIVHSAFRMVNNVSKKVNTTRPELTPIQAINLVAVSLGIKKEPHLKIINKIDSTHYLMDGHEISLEFIPVQLMYFSVGDQIRLVWNLSIYEHSKNHWWSVRIDAISGEILDKIDWVISCAFEACDHSLSSHSSRRSVPLISSRALSPIPAPGTDQYTVFALPLESPNHGPRTLVVGPSNLLASPYGWHDNDGAVGAEFTTTQGNNVHATEDINNNNGLGYLPNGGASLNFDFPLNFVNSPASNQDAAITNLFYWNNILHDVYYQYGFDETSGNFQTNNYGKGGLGNDYVFAEALDGGGTNNANFATPADGSNPRMQMYLWSGSTAQYLLTINNPTEISGQFIAKEASFGPGVPTSPLTSNFVLVDDGTGSPNQGCATLINSTAIAGKIALVYRGTCSFVQKVQNAQNAGALGVIVVNNVAGAPTTMGGTSTSIAIPSIMISNVDGALIIPQLTNGVNGTIQSQGTIQSLDGDFDNGIIAHEYGHGISNRLTGGPSNTGCLSNAEQMGEGWSDWFGLMLTMKPGDLGITGRGIGTFALAEPISGQGIRPTRYSTDFGINPSTYGTTNSSSISQPHGIGYVWCTMLWDLNWALIDRYGFDVDVYNGSGGNNIAMALVIEALKLQPCSPGFVDGRDALLSADMVLFNGANQCLIWSVFATRGLGYSAIQGSTFNRSDQVEAFDLPIISCNAKLDLTLFIEGFYIPSSNPPSMVAAYHNNDLFASNGTASTSTDVDSITVELYTPNNLLAPAWSQTKMLNTSGTLLCSFPDLAVGENYYIVLKSKNTVEIWSANPVLMTEATTYNFSNSMAKAYTDNTANPMATLAPGLFGLYSGDLNQDDFIDGFDYSTFLSDQIISSGFLNFFLASDLNGDGFVDSFDFPTYNYNSAAGLVIQRP